MTARLSRQSLLLACGRVRHSTTLALGQYTDLYDLVSGTFLARCTFKQYRLKLVADQAAVVVQVPPAARIEVKGGLLLADGTPIDFRVRNPVPAASRSR